MAGPVLIVNARSGGGDGARAVADEARARAIDVRVVGASDRLETLVAEAVEGGADALGIASGDGSLGVVASAALAHDLPFICVPVGTRNHFAIDLGLDPDDPVAALDAFGGGTERRIDVGLANRRVFLNNVSLGVYGEAVGRPGYRNAKLQTIVETVLGPSSAAPELRVVDDLGREHRRPAVVLASNNPYAPDPPAGRPALDTGRLGVIVVDALPRLWTANAVTVDAPATLHAGIDGEAVDLEPPVEVTILPSALRVRA
jgi:diacylglycerol kinase family enzyme